MLTSFTTLVYLLPLKTIPQSLEASSGLKMDSDIKQNPWMVDKLEKYFNWHGQAVARKPWLFILVSLSLCGLASVGLLQYKTESNPYKLWIPPDSDFVRNTDWLWSNFPPDSRFHSVIITADNVLHPDVLQHVFNIHQTIENVKSGEGRTWDKHCYQIPVVDLRGQDVSAKVEDDGTLLNFASEEVESSSDNSFDYSDYYDYFNIEQKRRKRSLTTIGDSDPSVELYPQDYCNIVNELTQPKCLAYSIAELFANEDFKNGPQMSMADISSQTIINAINEEKHSKVFLFNKDFHTYLGGIERNSTGHIIGAKATFVQFFGHVNLTAITSEDRQKSSIGAPVDQGTLEFEEALIQSLLQLRNQTQNQNFQTYFNVARAFNDLSDESISTDVSRLVGGISIVYMYACFMLGGFDCVNQKPLLGFIGLSSVFLAVMASYGICSAMNLLFSPMHNIVPFLLLGIGIDDMFVIVQCLSNLEQKDSKWLDKPVEELVGETMRHAGVAITITSLTDFIVFMVGAATVLPALFSFCIYCGVGVMIVYILQATYFVAFLTMDAQRIRAHRNAFLPCISMAKPETPRELKHSNPGKVVFQKFATFLMHPASKVTVVILTGGLTALGAYGVTELKQEFNPAWFLPPRSYLTEWMNNKEEYFPNKGERVTINIGEIDYEKELWKVEAMIEALERETEIVTNVDSWLGQFRSYVTDNQLIQGYFDLKNVTDIEFFYRLTQFLYSPSGSKYRKNFHFGSNLVCGLNSPPIKLSTIEFTHKMFSGPTEHLPAMNRIKELVASFNFSSTAFAVGQEYAGWETDEIIAYETFRNLGFSLLCVFIVTALLIVQPKSCLLVFTCVALTIVDVTGFMHFWGLTIDVVSCVTLVISVGLSIDYSAHVAHTFLVSPEEDKNKRAIETLSDIGSAVMNGGFSTFLAFVITSTSESHVFLTFFKIFTLVVIFGLYHGLVFLPVLLSIIPDPRKSKSKDENVGNVNEGYA